MEKEGKFIDPALGEDRFDFTGEPLDEEDIEKSPEGEWEE